MSLTSVLFLAAVFFGFALCIFQRPFYGLLTYFFVYFICPNPSINWWAKSIPEWRWSLLAAIVLIIGTIINKKGLNNLHLAQIKAGAWLIGFLILSVFVSFYAVDSDRSFIRCYDFFRYIVVFYLMIKCVKTDKDLLYVVVFFLFCGFLLGYFAYEHPRSSGRLEGVGTPDTADANGLALILATILPLGFSVFMYDKKILKFFSALFVVSIMNGIVLCNSRGAIVSLCVGFICLTFMTRRIPGLKLKMVAIGIVGICAFAYLADDQFWERFQTIAKSSSTDRGSGRLDVWSHGLKMVNDYPIGGGGDSFQILSPQYMSQDMLTARDVRSSHNTYLLILVEQGFLGLLIYLCFLKQLFHDLNKGRKSLLATNHKLSSSETNKEFIFLYTVNISITTSLICHMVGAFLGNRLYYEFIYYLAALAIIVRLLSVKTVSIDSLAKSPPS